MPPEIRDIKARGFDQRWCQNAAKVRGVPFEILAKRDRNVGKQRHATVHRRKLRVGRPLAYVSSGMSNVERPPSIS